MDLILWRHAQAHQEGRLAEQGDLEVDLARRLTSKGERQAERMAHWLRQRLPQTTRVLSSPALRCQQTAQALALPFKTLPSLNPHASVDDLLVTARWPQARDAVLIVGHQPTLGQLAARLMTGQSQDWSVRKGAIWWLRSRERDGLCQVSLHAVQNPDFL